MSNQHDDTGAKPQVIDLEAEEIRSDSDAPASAAAQEIREDAAHAFSPPPPRKKSRGAATWIIAALILGGLGGGWLYRGVLSSYLPSNEMVALKNQVAALEQNNSDLGAQIAAVKQGADGAVQAAASATDAAAKAADAAKAKKPNSAGKSGGVAVMTIALASAMVLSRMDRASLSIASRASRASLSNCSLLF